MSKCTLLVESLEGYTVSEDYLRGYLEAFGVVAESIRADRGRSVVICERCYDILDRLTTMNADHQRATHKGKKLKFQLIADDSAPLGDRAEASKELVVTGFINASISRDDLACLFGLYGKVVSLRMRDSSASIQFYSLSSAVAALSALNEGFFRGCFLRVDYSRDMHYLDPNYETSGAGVLEAGVGLTVLQISNPIEAEEYFSHSHISSSDSQSSISGLQEHFHRSVADKAEVASVALTNSPKLVLSVSEDDEGAEADSESVITLDSTNASSIVSTLDTDDSRFADSHLNLYLKTSNDQASPRISSEVDAADFTSSRGAVLWLQPSDDEKIAAEEAHESRSQLLQSLQEKPDFCHRGTIGIAPRGSGDERNMSNLSSDLLFESFLSFDPTLLDSAFPREVDESFNRKNDSEFEPVVIDLVNAQISDVKCAITGTSMSATQYDQYLSLVNAYFAETTAVEQIDESTAGPIGGRFVVRDNSTKSVAFSDLSDDLVGGSLNHDTAPFVPKSRQPVENKDLDGGSVSSSGFVKRTLKSTDHEDTSEGGEFDDLSQDNTKGEYSIHSGQFEPDIRNIFVGNIGRLLSDGVQQLKAYFAALDIIVLKVDIKISFAFLEVRNTPLLQGQIDAIAIGSGGKPPPFGKDERTLRIEFVQQSSAGKRSIRLRREGQQSPTSSLFIVGFDHRRTPTSLLTSIFSPFGPLDYVELKNNYAFVKFIEVGDAIAAQKKTHGMTIQERTLSVEFSSRHLVGNKSIASDCGDTDSHQERSSSVGSKGDKTINDRNQRSLGLANNHGALPISKALYCRIEDDRMFGSSGRGGFYDDNETYKQPFTRYHRKGERHEAKFKINAASASGYHDYLRSPAFPPSMKCDLAPSYSGYPHVVDPSHSCLPHFDYSQSYDEANSRCPVPLRMGFFPPKIGMDGWNLDSSHVKARGRIRNGAPEDSRQYGGSPGLGMNSPMAQRHDHTGHYHSKDHSPLGGQRNTTR